MNANKTIKSGQVRHAGRTCFHVWELFQLKCIPVSSILYFFMITLKIIGHFEWQNRMGGIFRDRRIVGRDNGIKLLT